MKRVILLLTIVIAGTYQTVWGQNVAVKTNLLSDAILSPNLGIEIGLAPKWTLDVTGQFNGWNLSHDRKWKHWAIQPEARYWLCDRFGAHFLARICTADSTTSADSTAKSTCWERMPAS